MVLKARLRQQVRAATIRAVLVSLFGLAGLCSSRAAFAEPLACTLVGGADAAASLAGKPLALPANLPDCAEVHVTSGAVVACVATQLDTLKCEKLSEGATITPSVFGPKTVVQGWIASLVALLGSGAASVDAQSRGGADSLPSGQVLMAALRFEVDFTHKAFAHIEAVEFHEGNPQGALVVRVPGYGVRTVDAAQFMPGKTYSWAILPAGHSVPFYGQFVVLDEATRREADKLVQQVIKAQADPQIKAILSADSLYQQGYVFDAAQVLKQGYPVP